MKYRSGITISLSIIIFRLLIRNVDNVKQFQIPNYYYLLQNSLNILKKVTGHNIFQKVNSKYKKIIESVMLAHLFFCMSQSLF